MTTSYLRRVKDQVQDKGKMYISLKCALWDQADLEKTYGLKTTLEPFPVSHPRYGELYTLKAVN